MRDLGDTQEGEDVWDDGVGNLGGEAGLIPEYNEAYLSRRSAILRAKQLTCSEAR